VKDLKRIPAVSRGLIPVVYEDAEGLKYLNALKNHHVVKIQHIPDGVAVRAEAGTGWNYTVTVVKFPEPVMGGQYVVTVLSPWTAAYSLGDPYGIRPEQVREHFVTDEWDTPENVAAITATINYALGMHVRRHTEETS
jgi:hypothetical protein